jgi:dTDP-glucose 4,6-dehydratase
MKNYEKRILVTGGAGFIGSAFLRLFVPNHPNWLFVNLDLLTYAGNLNKLDSIVDYENYKFYKGDMCDSDLLKEMFTEFDFNAIINFAAESHVDNSIKDSTDFLLTNVIGTHTLIETARKYWTDNLMLPDSRFIQVSTDEVYGSLDFNDNPSREDDNYLPNSPYSASKASAELICRSYFKTFGFPVIITRSSNNYGPFQNHEKLIPKIITNAIIGVEIPIYGDGKNIRDWIYVDDNCTAIFEVLMNGLIGEVYNIGGENELNNIGITKKILEVMNLNNYDDLVVHVEDRLGHDFRYSLDIDKIKKLGWKPRVKFDKGLRLTIEHYLCLFDAT